MAVGSAPITIPQTPVTPAVPADTETLPPYRPPRVAFVQPLEFLAGTCGKTVPGDPACASSGNPLAS